MFQNVDKARSSGIAARARLIAIACAALGTAVIVFGFPSLGNSQPLEEPAPAASRAETDTSSLMDASGTAQRLAMIKNAPVPPDPPPTPTPDTADGTATPPKPAEPETPAKYSGVLASGSSRIGIFNVDGKQWVAGIGDKKTRGEGKPAVEVVAIEADHAMVKVGDAEPTKIELAPRSTAGPSAVAAAAAPTPGASGAASASSAEARAERVRALRNRRSRPQADAKRNAEGGDAQMESERAEEGGEK